jgi:hypothetical protein
LSRAAAEPAYVEQLRELSRGRAKKFDFDWDERACVLVTGNGRVS